MKAGRSLLLLTLSLISLPMAALAASPRASSTVSADYVTLGDVFEDVGDSAGRTVMSAPAPGRTLVLDSSALNSLARSNGVAWQSSTGQDYVKIERAAQRFDAAALSEALLHALALPTPTQGQTTIQLDNPQLVLFAPLGTPAELSFSQLARDESGQRFSGLVSLKVGEQILTQNSISGRIVSKMDIPVVNRPIRRGDVVSASDIAWQSIDVSPASNGYLFAAEDVIGKTPRTALRPGMPIRAADLSTPPVIKRGTLVTMVYAVGRMQITAHGRALADAVAGAPLRVVNTTSNRTVEGIAGEDGLVRVGLDKSPVPPSSSAPRLAAAPDDVSVN